jgi:hypothetical protein
MNAHNLRELENAHELFLLIKRSRRLGHYPYGAKTVETTSEVDAIFSGCSGPKTSEGSCTYSGVIHDTNLINAHSYI